ncbi:MAG: 30S ribosomal protein S1 [Hyphomicrobiales bacterium]
MAETQATETLNPMREEFARLLEESLDRGNLAEGSVVKGNITAMENDFAIIDVGLKTEGRVALREFHRPEQEVSVKVGDEVEVYLERVENALGEAVLSREKARREEAWQRLETLFANDERVDGQIFGRVKGGFMVDLNGAVAFLPGSQVDIRPIRDVTPLLDIVQPFRVLKLDRRRGNIVVSRRAILEETRAEQRSELVQSLAEDQVLEGVVKNITDYGAFVDLGGIDGLLHVTDISWKRVRHPGDVLSVGQTVKVRIIRINPETQRISLGMKQLEKDPWEGVKDKYPASMKLNGKVTNITDYGAFVELEEGVEGLVHVSEMSWTRKNIHPGKVLSIGEEIEVMVLEVDPNKRRISLGLKQCRENPWKTFADKRPEGSRIEGPIKNITEFGLFIGLDGDVDGMVHLSDLDWKRASEEAIKSYAKGDVVKAVVLDVDVEKERISLGIKQLEDDPMKSLSGFKKGAVVTCKVIGVKDNGLDVEIAESEFTTFVRRAELSRERSEQRSKRFAVGDKFDARVTQIDKANRKILVSIKALEIAREKEAIAQYGSADSGASLGEILGAALSKAQKVAGNSSQEGQSEVK